MKKQILQIIAVSIVLSGCCGTKLTQRYRKLTPLEDKDKPADVTSGITINSAARDVPAAIVANQYVLTDHGQAAYINALSALKPKNADELQSNLFPDVSGLDKGPSSIDNTMFTKRLLFTVLSNTPYESDRITKLAIHVHLDSKVTKIKILNFDKITTEYQTVDLGTINQSNALTLGATANYGVAGKITTGNTGNTTSTTVVNPDGSTVVTGNPSTTSGSEIDPSFGVGLSASYNRSTSETVNLKNRYISLTGYIKDDVLTFEEESITGVNLTGNILSDIKFKITDKTTTYAYSVSNLTTENKLSDPDKIKIKVIPVFTPTTIGALNLKVDYDYTVRHVINENGRKTFSESDDDISYYSITTKDKPVDMSLENRDDLIVKTWFIGIKSNALQVKDIVSGKDAGNMFFTSYDNCVSFFRYLKKVKLTNGKLICGDYEFSASTGTLDNLIKGMTVEINE
jgi:hypothetical protein